MFLGGFHQRFGVVDNLYDVCPMTPRTEAQCEDILNVLRYEQRREERYGHLFDCTVEDDDTLDFDAYREPALSRNDAPELSIRVDSDGNRRTSLVSS